MSPNEVFQVVCEQVEELQSYCDKNFLNMSGTEKGYLDFFARYVYTGKPTCSKCEAMDAVVFVYLSDNSMIGGFSVDFVYCRPLQVWKVIEKMSKTAGLAIDFIAVFTRQEAEWVRAGNIFFQNQ